MKIAHLTDLHFQTPPRLRDMLHPKRWIGSSNLYLLGRYSKFTIETQRAAIQAATEKNPDLFLMTGDITAQALEDECALARQELSPLLDKVPSFLIPGNHDIYTQNTLNKHFRNHLGTWLPPQNPHLFRHNNIAALYIETCRVDFLSRGWVDPQALQKATTLLASSDADFTFLCIHYPILGRRGELYGPSTRAIRNAPILQEWLKSAPIDMVLHGHEHHGYRIPIETAKGSIPISNPGSSGYARDEKRDRRAHFCIYTIEDGKLTDVRRYAQHESGFKETNSNR